MPLFLPSLGFTEILAISVLVIVLFGAKRLPQIGAGLGKGIRNFKDSVTGKDEKKLEKNETKDAS
ncbi:MAG: twin-arginine translocase TatA/TatE family subunit [Acidobacteria bacterium]|nr:twin-arginine translocase TatA/TatE family subunit [Acidobacteriota bacterium]